MDTEAASKDVVGKFGFERTMYVLASTVRHFDYDGRISYKNKKWALTIPNYDDMHDRKYYENQFKPYPDVVTKNN